MYKLAMFFFLILNSPTIRGQSKNFNEGIEQIAYFKNGGIQGFNEYLSENLITPDSRGLFKAKGKMDISFVIDSTGNNFIQEIKNDITFTGSLMENSKSKQNIFITFCENDIKRVFAKMPKWIPAIQNNVHVPSKVAVTVGIIAK